MSREFWAVYDKSEKKYVSIPELFVSQPLAEKYDKPFKVIEYSAIDELVAGLREYGDHTPSCQFHAEDQCTCGLDEFLAKYEGKEKANGFRP